jgi:hypothetical protein
MLDSDYGELCSALLIVTALVEKEVRPRSQYEQRSRRSDENQDMSAQDKVSLGNLNNST